MSVVYLIVEWRKDCENGRWAFNKIGLTIGKKTLALPRWTRQFFAKARSNKIFNF